MTKNLAQRLERLEENMLAAAAGETLLLVVQVDPNRKVVSSFELKVSCHRGRRSRGSGEGHRQASAGA